MVEYGKHSYAFCRPWTGAVVATSFSYAMYPLLFVASRPVSEAKTWASLDAARNALAEVIGVTLVIGSLGVITGIGVVLWVITLILARLLVQAGTRLGGEWIVFLIGGAGIGLIFGGVLSMVIREMMPMAQGLLTGLLSGLVLRGVSGPIRVEGRGPDDRGRTA